MDSGNGRGGLALADVMWAPSARPFEVLAGLSASELMSMIEHAEVAQTRLAFQQAQDMAALRDKRVAEQRVELADVSRSVAAQAAAVDEQGWVATEIGMALGLSENQVRGRIDFADALGRYPHVALLAAQGAAPVWTLQRLLEHLDELSGLVSLDALAEIEAATVDWLRGGRRTVAQLNRRMRRLILRAKAESGLTGDDEVAGAHAERDVRVRSRGDGTVEVWARLPEPDALAVAAALRAATSGAPTEDDERTVAQRRADTIVAAVTGQAALYGCSDDRPAWAAADRTGVAARIDVTIPVRTLTGAGGSPGEVPGYGLVPSGTARDLASTPGAVFRGLLFDADTGRLVGLAPDLGSVHWVQASQPGTAYAHPPVMDALARARDVRCRAPGCGRAAAGCDCDHVEPWPSGPTSLANTCCLCRYHHRLKTHARGWRVEGAGDDGLTWTTPSGRTATTEPHDYREDEPPF